MQLHLDTAAERRRYTVRSSIDAPLTVDASSWREALVLALQLLEQEELVARLSLSRVRHEVRAEDPVSGAFFVVGERGTAWGAKRMRQAA